MSPLFEKGPYSQLIKREKNKLEYIRSLNLLLLSTKRIGETYSEDLKIVLPNLISIVNSVECSIKNGYQKWIEKKLDPKVQFDKDGVNINQENNQLNDLEKLLLVLIFQNFKLSKSRYNKQVESLLASPEVNVKSLVKSIRTKTDTKKSNYVSLIEQYGKPYLNCYMGLQILFLSAYNQNFKEFLLEMFKDNYDKKLKWYTQEQQKMGFRLTDEEILKKFMKDDIIDGSSYFYFDIYDEFIEAIGKYDLSEMKPLAPPITSDNLVETYTVMCDRKENYWLLEGIEVMKFELEYDVFYGEIDNYPLFSLLDIIIAEVFFPGMNKLYDSFISVGHAYDQSESLFSHYLSAGGGRLSYLLTCSDIGKYKEVYWF